MLSFAEGIYNLLYFLRFAWLKRSHGYDVKSEQTYYYYERFYSKALKKKMNKALENVNRVCVLISNKHRYQQIALIYHISIYSCQTLS